MEIVCVCSKLNIERVQAKKNKQKTGGEQNWSLMHGGEDGKQKMIKKMGHCSSWEINKGEKGVKKDYQSTHRDNQMAGATMMSIRKHTEKACAASQALRGEGGGVGGSCG